VLAVVLDVALPEGLHGKMHPGNGGKMNRILLKLHLAASSILKSNDGQSMSEYVMAVGVIALGCVAGEAAIAHSVNETLVTVATTITTGLAR
jgi:hypothetical protein